MIGKGSILGRKSDTKQNKGILESRLNGPSLAILRGRECRSSELLKLSTDAFSHVLQAARALIELDELQANAVAARIELDLRIGAAFTRLQTLQLQNISPTLENQTISYGTWLFWYHKRLSNSIFRVLSIPNTRFRGRSLPAGQEFQTGKVLGHQSHAYPRWNQSQLPLEASSPL